MPQWKDLPRETKAGVIRSLAVHNDEGEEPYPSNSVVSTLSPITLVNRELLEVAGRHSWEVSSVAYLFRSSNSPLKYRQY